MNKIVRGGYPVSELPEDLREGLDVAGRARVVIEQEEPASEPALSLDELFAMRRPPYKTTEEIVAEVRCQRDEWHDR